MGIRGSHIAAHQEAPAHIQIAGKEGQIPFSFLQKGGILSTDLHQLGHLETGLNLIQRTVGDFVPRSKLIKGTKVECVQKSPAGDPIAYLIRGAVIALRSEDSSQIYVE